MGFGGTHKGPFRQLRRRGSAGYGSGYYRQCCSGPVQGRRLTRILLGPAIKMISLTLSLQDTIDWKTRDLGGESCQADKEPNEG